MTPSEGSGEHLLTQALLQHRGMLYGFIYSLVRDTVAAEDIFQEVAVVALRKENESDEVIREPAKWLREVARRTVKAGFRTRSGCVIEVAPDYLEQVAQVFETDEASQQETKLAALGDCMEKVSPENRDVLRQRYVSGSRYDEIAKGVGRSSGALRTLVHRLQRLLADCVQRRLGGATE